MIPLILLAVLYLIPTPLEEDRRIINTAYANNEVATVEDIIEEPKEEVKKVDSIYCSCILYLKSRGVGISGNASTLIPTYQGPAYKGFVVLFKYNNGEYHAALVEEVYPSGNFLISEANYERCQFGERVVFKDDPALRGFIHRMVEDY